MASEIKTKAKLPSWLYTNSHAGILKIPITGSSYELHLMKSEELSYDKFLSDTQAIKVLATRTYISGGYSTEGAMDHMICITHTPPINISIERLSANSSSVAIIINDKNIGAIINLYDITDFSMFQQMCTDLNK